MADKQNKYKISEEDQLWIDTVALNAEQNSNSIKKKAKLTKQKESGKNAQR